MNAKWIATALLCALSGCATLQIDRGSIPTEAAYQVLNAYDFAQTVMVARNPIQYGEGAWPTRSIIGFHPKTGAVLAFGALLGLSHYAVTAWIDREADATGSDAWNIARWAWRIGSLADPAYNVSHGRSLGLRPFGGTIHTPTTAPSFPVPPPRPVS